MGPDGLVELTRVSEEHATALFRVLEAVGFFEALLNFYWTTRRHVPEDYVLHSHRHKPHNSYVGILPSEKSSALFSALKMEAAVSSETFILV